MRAFGLLLGGVVFAAGFGLPALSQEARTAPKPSVITSPDWERRPSAEDLAAVYPQRALRQEVSGRAIVRCRVTASGTLTSCVVTEETPAGMEFGEAALRLTPLMSMKPQTKDGAPVAGAMVSIPIRFTLEDSDGTETAPSWGPAPRTTLPCVYERIPQETRNTMLEVLEPAVKAAVEERPVPEFAPSATVEKDVERVLEQVRAACAREHGWTQAQGAMAENFAIAKLTLQMMERDVAQRGLTTERREMLWNKIPADVDPDQLEDRMNEFVTDADILANRPLFRSLTVAFVVRRGLEELGAD